MIAYIPSFRVIVVEALADAIDDSLCSETRLDTIIMVGYFGTMNLGVLMREVVAIEGSFGERASKSSCKLRVHRMIYIYVIINKYGRLRFVHQRIAKKQ